MDPIFDLASTPSIISYKHYQYNKYYENNGDASLNNLDELVFNIKDRESYLHLNGGYLLLKVRIKRTGNTPVNIDAAGRVCFPVAATNVFRRWSFSVENNILEDTSPAGDANNILNLRTLTDFEFDYVERNGMAWQMRKDATDGLFTDASILSKAAFHTPSAADNEGNYNYFMVPLALMFSSHDALNNVFRGTAFEYRFYRASRTDAVLSQSATTGASVNDFEIDRAYIYLPRVDPSPEAQLALNEQMANNSIIVKWPERKIYRSEQYAGTVSNINWRLTTTSNKPIRIWIYAQLVNRMNETDNRVNKFHFDNVGITRLRVNINGVFFPKEEIKNSDGRDYSRQLQQIYQAGGKQLDTRSSGCISLEDLLPVGTDREFNFYCLPLDVDPELFKSGISTDIFVECDRTASANPFHVFAILESERETQLRFLSGKVEQIV